MKINYQVELESIIKAERKAKKEIDKANASAQELINKAIFNAEKKAGYVATVSTAND